MSSKKQIRDVHITLKYQTHQDGHICQLQEIATFSTCCQLFDTRVIEKLADLNALQEQLYLALYDGVAPRRKIPHLSFQSVGVVTVPTTRNLVNKIVFQD